MSKIQGFKGFDKNLKCRNYQYEIDKDFEHDGEVEACSSGFHFCENPLDVFNYYPPSNSRYCEVEGDGEVDRDGEDSKVAVSKLHIGVEIGLRGLIDAGVKFVLDRVKWEEAKESNTGDQSAATNTGYQSAATNTGYQSAATNTGDQSAATNTGDRSAATNTGYRSAATNTGYQSAATNTGDQSAATNTGYQSAAIVEGKESIAIATGYESKAKGALGCWIVVTEWFEDDNFDYRIKDVKSIRVDGENIKENTFYMLKNGEFIEVE
jgi:hypothetical protein